MENRGGLFSCRIWLPLLPSHVRSQGLHSVTVRKSSLKVLLSWRFFPNSIKICITAELSRSTHVYIWTIHFLSARGIRHVAMWKKKCSQGHQCHSIIGHRHAISGSRMEHQSSCKRQLCDSPISHKRSKTGVGAL